MMTHSLTLIPTPLMTSILMGILRMWKNPTKLLEKMAIEVNLLSL